MDFKEKYLLLSNAFKDFTFIEDGHKYVYDPTGEMLKSTTNVIKRYDSFEDKKDHIVRATAKKLGISQGKVKASWEEKAFLSTERGTFGHNLLENLIYNKYIKTPISKRIEKKDVITYAIFVKSLEVLEGIIKDYIRDNTLIPLFLEFVVGDMDYRFCGMVDKLAYDPVTDEIVMRDYKTNEDYKKESKYRFKGGLKHLDSCHLNKHALQLGLYSHIIEKNTDIKIDRKEVVWLNWKEGKYEIISLPSLDDEIKIIIKELTNG